MGFFSGQVTLSGEARDGAAILELVGREGIVCRRFFSEGDGSVRVVLSARAAKHLCKVCCEADIRLSVIEKRWLPDLAERYGKRIGLWLGVLAATLLVWLSSKVVWDIRVTGNQMLSDEEIKEILAESGLFEGTYLPKFDASSTENRVLLSHSEIGWIAINIKGTTANVEVSETVRGRQEGKSAANLVAARDGKIERIEVYDGSVCVKVGEVVRAGEVLVSGVYEGVGSLRTTRAAGKIYARTVREFSVEIPLKSTEKVYTGREWCEKYINFFSKRIKVFANTGNVGATCDIIYYNGGLGLSDGTSVPIGMETVLYREYREQEIMLDGQTAMERAFTTLEGMLETFVTESQAELLKKTVTYELDEDAYRLRCEVICVENIALTRELDID